jgi:hypothetical protein
MPQGTVRHRPAIGSPIACTNSIHIQCLDTWFRERSARGACPSCKDVELTWFTEVESEDGNKLTQDVSFAEAIRAGREEPLPVFEGFRFFNIWDVRPPWRARLVLISLYCLSVLLMSIVGCYVLLWLFCLKVDYESCLLSCHSSSLCRLSDRELSPETIRTILRGSLCLCLESPFFLFVSMEILIKSI